MTVPSLNAFKPTPRPTPKFSGVTMIHDIPQHQVVFEITESDPDQFLLRQEGGVGPQGLHRANMNRRSLQAVRQLSRAVGNLLGVDGLSSRPSSSQGRRRESQPKMSPAEMAWTNLSAHHQRFKELAQYMALHTQMDRDPKPTVQFFDAQRISSGEIKPGGIRVVYALA